MWCIEATRSLWCFTGAFISYLMISVFCIKFQIESHLVNTVVLLTYSAFTYLILRRIYQDELFRIVIRAAFLGTICALGVYVKLATPPHIEQFGVYMVFLSIFHYSEFLTIAIIRPHQVSVDSFMLTHSPQYMAAALASWIEFFLEAYFFPDLKTLKWLSTLGLCVCLYGEALRKVAMFTAGSNFNHLVQTHKEKNHVLVTNGVYALFRHPSYVGWFYWAIGSQIILLNPLCAPAYAFSSYVFFKQRIYVEEIMLLNFFGQQYCDYQAQVSTGLPFIEGYKI